MFGHETFPTVFRDVHQVKQNPVVFILSHSVTASSPIKGQKFWKCAGVRLIEVWLYLCLPVINNSACTVPQMIPRPQMIPKMDRK